MIYIKVNPDTQRVTAMAAPGFHCGAGEIAVELTEAMQGNPADYVLMDGTLVYSPEAEAPEVYEPSMEERLQAQEEQIANLQEALAMLLSGVTDDA